MTQQQFFENVYHLCEMKGRIEREDHEDGSYSEDYSPEWEPQDKEEFAQDLMDALPSLDPDVILDAISNNDDDHWGIDVEAVEEELKGALEATGWEYQGDNAGDEYQALCEVCSEWYNKADNVDYDEDDESDYDEDVEADNDDWDDDAF